MDQSEHSSAPKRQQAPRRRWPACPRIAQMPLPRCVRLRLNPPNPQAQNQRRGSLRTSSIGTLELHWPRGKRTHNKKRIRRSRDEQSRGYLKAGRRKSNGEPAPSIDSSRPSFPTFFKLRDDSQPTRNRQQDPRKALSLGRFERQRKKVTAKGCQGPKGRHRRGKPAGIAGRSGASSLFESPGRC